MTSSSEAFGTSGANRAVTLGRRALYLRRAGRLPQAVALLHEAVRLDPGHPGLVGNLGNALCACGQRAAGLVALGRACVLDPESALLAYNLGRGLLEEGRLEEARVVLERVLALGGLEAEARTGLGRIDEIEGRLAEAERHWRRAAECAPHLARPQLLLARVGRPIDPAPLEALLSAPGTAPAVRAEACFALGHFLESQGEHPRAFVRFQEANAWMKGLLPPFDPAGHEREVERLARAFDARFFRELEPAHPGDAAMFVVGLPRSGTTLVETLLAAHPEVRGCGERTEISALARGWNARGYPENPLAVTPDERVLAAGAYLEALDPGGAATRVTDKMPGNYVHLGVIAALFANARVVDCRRDPMDTALSLFVQLFEGKSLLFSYDLEHIARVVCAHRRLMDHWRACLPLALHEIVYEELVEAPEDQAKALVRFAGLDWQEECLRHRPERVLTASGWRVRTPIDRGSIGRWRSYEQGLAPLRARLRSAGVVA